MESARFVWAMGFLPDGDDTECHGRSRPLVAACGLMGHRSGSADWQIYLSSLLAHINGLLLVESHHRFAADGFHIFFYSCYWMEETARIDFYFG
ncbi:hypothetical protein ACLOJK_034229, partial [Asimina triloba]